MAARQTSTAGSGNRRTAAAAGGSSAKTSRGSTSSKGKTSAKKSTAAKKSTSAKGTTRSRAAADKNKNDVDYRARSGMYDEIELIVALALSILLLLSIYDLCGLVGNYISYFVFGVFGWIAYLIPYVIFFGTAFYISNRHNKVAVVKIIAGIITFISVMAFLQMLSNPGDTSMSVLDFYEDCAVYKNGGGLIGGAICRALTPLFGKPGAYLIIIALFAVSVVLLAGKSVFLSIGRRMQNAAAAAGARHREHRALMDQAREEQRQEAEAARLERMENEPELFAAQAAVAQDDFPDIDDFDDFDADVPAPAGKGRKGRAGKKSGQTSNVRMIEPEKSYGEPVNPIDFKLPKMDDKGAADTSAKAQFGRTGEINDNKDSNKDTARDNTIIFPTSEKHGQADADPLANLTITRMDSIRKAPEPDFEFTPDPVYMEPKGLDSLSLDIDLDAQTKPSGDIIPDTISDPFGTTERLPDLSAFDMKLENKPAKPVKPKVTTGAFPETADERAVPDVLDIRDKSIEERYTNLPEFEPREDDISPLEAIRLAAGKLPGREDNGRGGLDSQAQGGRGAVGNGAKAAGHGAKADNTPVDVAPEEFVPVVKEYVFPPLELLKPGKPVTASEESDRELQETARKLQDTLDSFGVKVQVTNVSCGPSVTRYELQPEQGVKVSRILSLTDDIKLNLAVADIRIEAPIPGKAAIGIEVPNKENTTVMLRDLLESQEFKKSASLIAFAAGRDIGGQVIIADIAKMPHLLIAGATGSGKSVCINTLIMSIIYKAKPEDVRLIMIDPKVVELSVYNGIPHLLIPVVTDPKKAAGALNWAVAEMTKRYEKFAELNVRDMKSYNAKIAACEYESTEHQKLPQIVIIVDELADLMMVASNEVEDAICRLAQLARAAGIHLVIATQRPSVNVITGLIKANIPSRIAFSVSSGVDSRTIIDMNGAEKLLGKGDMLFYPTGIQKPMRVQGAFVSDQEVNAVVEFLTKDQETPVYNEAIVSSISSGKLGGDKGGADDHDVYFVEAGKLIIEKDKASIGMLQRVYRIGFNRAARIMDQLSEAGVVGPEEGTKPRKVLMSPEQFEQYIEEYL